MKLNCCECQTPLKAEHINIHDKIAVCPNCDAIFTFDLPIITAKRRKVHQPKGLMITDEDSKLHLSFRTNFRLDKNKDFINSVTLGLIFTIIAPSFQSTRTLGIFPVLFSLLAIASFYWTAITVYNKTHIEMDATTIKTSRRPLPIFSQQNHHIERSGIESITTEETTISQQENYDTPRYNVYANRYDGSQALIVADVIETYGLFIAQTLNAELSLHAPSDYSRLHDTAEDTRTYLSQSDRKSQTSDQSYLSRQ